MLARITSRQLSEWMAYAALEPFGEERADMRAATIACLIANANRDPKKKPEPFKIDDFMLFGDAKVERGAKQTWREQKERLLALSRLSGG